MFKENYYYLVAGLPELFFDKNKRVNSSIDFKNSIKEQVSNADFELIELLYLTHDNKHLLNLLFETEEKVDAENLHSIPPKSYIINFLEWAENKNPKTMKLEFENKLYSLYYEYLLTSQNKFLNDWFTLELNIKNIFTAFNCKQYNFPIEKHLIQTKQNKSVNSLLQSKHLKHELFEDEIPLAKQIFTIIESKTKAEDKEREIDSVLWDYLDEQTCFHYFSIEKILSHIIKLNIIERWSGLSETEGQAFLNKLIEEIKLGYNHLMEFSTVK